MDLFGIGTGEILLVIVIALIIWGPERVVEIAKTLGKLAHTLRKASFDLTGQLTRELDGEKESSPPQSSDESTSQTDKSSEPDTKKPDTT